MNDKTLKQIYVYFTAYIQKWKKKKKKKLDNYGIFLE